MIQNSSFAIFWHLCSNFQRKSRLLCAVGIGIILGLHTAAAGSLHLDTQDISQATLSYRNLEEMFRERGFEVDHSSINRWVLDYAPMIEKLLRQFRKPHCGSIRVDET